jgi:hypothetical protein
MVVFARNDGALQKLAISRFIVNDKKLTEKQQLMGRVNYWQSVKWQGRYEIIRSEIEAFDVSAKSQEFQLAVLALTDNNDSFFNLLPEVIRHERLRVEDLQAWPLFREMRKDPRCAGFCQGRERAAGDATDATSASQSQAQIDSGASQPENSTVAMPSTAADEPELGKAKRKRKRNSG